MFKRAVRRIRRFFASYVSPLGWAVTGAGIACLIAFPFLGWYELLVFGIVAMVMMLAAGFGAAAAGSLLAAFGNHLDGNSATAALHATFLCVGAITLTSTMIFWQLPDTKPEPRQVEHVAE